MEHVSNLPPQWEKRSISSARRSRNLARGRPARTVVKNWSSASSCCGSGRAEISAMTASNRSCGSRECFTARDDERGWGTGKPETRMPRDRYIATCGRHDGAWKRREARTSEYRSRGRGSSRFHRSTPTKMLPGTFQVRPGSILCIHGSPTGLRHASPAKTLCRTTEGCTWWKRVGEPGLKRCGRAPTRALGPRRRCTHRQFGEITEVRPAFSL